MSDNLNFHFDETTLSKVIISYNRQGGNWHAAIHLTGAADGYGVYSAGITSEVALQRALESASMPERWRKLKFT